MERHFAETRRFFQLPQSFKEETLVDGNSRCEGAASVALPFACPFLINPSPAVFHGA